MDLTVHLFEVKGNVKFMAVAAMDLKTVFD